MREILDKQHMKSEVRLHTTPLVPGLDNGITRQIGHNASIGALGDKNANYFVIGLQRDACDLQMASGLFDDLCDALPNALNEAGEDMVTAHAES